MNATRLDVGGTLTIPQVIQCLVGSLLVQEEVAVHHALLHAARILSVSRECPPHGRMLICSAAVQTSLAHFDECVQPGLSIWKHDAD